MWEQGIGRGAVWGGVVWGGVTRRGINLGGVISRGVIGGVVQGAVRFGRDGLADVLGAWRRLHQLKLPQSK